MTYKIYDENGELMRIDAPVSPELEIAEITDRVSKAKNGTNKALLFTNVIGYEIPVWVLDRSNIAFVFKLFIHI